MAKGNANPNLEKKIPAQEGTPEAAEERKELGELENTFNFLKNYVVNNSGDLMKNNVKFDNIKKELEKAVTGLEKVSNSSTIVKNDLESFNKSSEDFFNELMKSKDKNKSPLYVNLANFANNLSLILSLFAKFNIDASSYVTAWKAKAEKYSTFSKKSGKKFDRLKNNLVALNKGLQGFKNYLKNLINLGESLNKYNISVFSPLFNFQDVKGDEAANQLTQMADELGAPVIENAEVLDNEENEKQIIQLNKDLSSLEGLFASLTKYTHELKNELVNIAASVGNLPKIQEESKKVKMRVQLVADLRELLEILEKVGDEANVMNTKFKGLIKGYDERLNELIFKFGENESSKLVKNSILMIGADLENLSSNINKLNNYWDGVKKVLDGARNLEQRLLKREIVKNIKTWGQIK